MVLYLRRVREDDLASLRDDNKRPGGGTRETIHHRVAIRVLRRHLAHGREPPHGQRRREGVYLLLEDGHIVVFVLYEQGHSCGGRFYQSWKSSGIGLYEYIHRIFRD
jgi:hypothetical protein